MKAAVYRSYGPPDVVRIEEIPTPEYGDDEILIRVHASTVNRTDCGFRSAEYFISRFFSGLFRPKFPVLGCEFAGVVEAIGAKVNLFKPGDRIFGFNDTRFGGHAEMMTVKESDAISMIPDGMSYETAAVLTEGAHYALCDIRAAKIDATYKVLVNGATGAIGSAAFQLIKHLGAEVTAVCSTQHLQTVKSLGADRVIDFTAEDFTNCNEQFDVVFDAVGKSSFGKCKKILKPKGIYMSTELGKGGQNIFLALITPFLGGKRVIFPLPSITKADVEYIKGISVSGKFQPLIDRTYSLDQIVEAHRYVETGQKIGNVVIQITPKNNTDSF